MNYENFKLKWEITKPIRGRVEDVRPIGRRARGWETVVRFGEQFSTSADGSPSYGAKLYNTICVEYFKDASIILRNGGWATPSTARFISDHSPFSCFKANNQLWVRVWDSDERNNSMLYPVGEELRLVRNGETYMPDRAIKINTRRIDREKAKAARAVLSPFLNFAKTFLKMSDGWVMHETRKEVFGWGEVKKRFASDCPIGFLKPDKFATYVHLPYSGKEIYEQFRSMLAEERHLEVLCMLIADEHARKITRVAESVKHDENNSYSTKFVDMQTDLTTLKRILYKFVDMHEDVHKIIEVDPKDKAISNAV